MTSYTRLTSGTLLLCPECDTASWHLTEHGKVAAHLYYLWCSSCAAREQDEFLTMVIAVSTAETSSCELNDLAARNCRSDDGSSFIDFEA
jgi:hypothetical protein